MAKYSYWTGMRVWTTSNSQIPGGVFGARVAANRLPTDTYVKSFWWATFSYDSDGSGTVPSWWANANVILTANFDPTGTLTVAPSVSSSEPKNRIFGALMYPERYSNPEYTPEYQVVWKLQGPGLESEGRRKGNGGPMPAVVVGLHAADQNGYFALVQEPAGLVRLSIVGRVLWESDQGP